MDVTPTGQHAASAAAATGYMDVGSVAQATDGYMAMAPTAGAEFAGFESSGDDDEEV
jgi:hypothetical protein